LSVFNLKDGIYVFYRTEVFVLEYRYIYMHIMNPSLTPGSPYCSMCRSFFLRNELSPQTYLSCRYIVLRSLDICVCTVFCVI